MGNITGGCALNGAIRYSGLMASCIVQCAAVTAADCRRHAGAPMVGWTMYAEDAVKVTKGDAKIYQSSEACRRQFCADCGTGLFYINANILPGIVDIQSGTYDDPDAVPANVHIQTAERLRWMERATNCRPSSAIRRRHSESPRFHCVARYPCVGQIRSARPLRYRPGASPYKRRNVFENAGPNS